MARRKRLGEVLVDDGVITELDLARALEAQNQGAVRRRLGTTLVDLGVASEEDIATALANQLGLERVDLNKVTPELTATAKVPADVARRHQVVPLVFEEDGTLIVAMTDPTNVLAIDELRMTTRASRVIAKVATATSVTMAIERFYAGAATMASVDAYADSLQTDEDEEEVDSAEIESKPIVRLANTLIVDAVRLRASDIHIEPTRGDVRVRFRVDGILTEVMKVPRPARAPLTSRLKLMAGMDISERRRPQDGRTAVSVHGQEVDLRVSSMPSMHGEKIVMRLLRRGGERLALDDLKLAPDVESKLIEALESPQGILLITGPTGSGKTTTVYAGLAEVATISRNVITLEDPIEYELDLVNQTQVNPRIGFTFAVGMRTVLRQDPDVVMVGEIRDPETAELAFEAAMTGHLVLSTVHTNNAPSTILRMSELGVERHLIASSLAVIVAQRLVRVVCDECGVDDDTIPDARLLRRLRLSARTIETITTRRRGEGCAQCADTGFKGRSSVTEVLEVTPRIRDLITDGARESTLRNVAREDGMRSMRQDGIIKVMLGITTFEEVVRATPDDPRLNTQALVEAMIEGSDGFAPFLIERRSEPRRRHTGGEPDSIAPPTNALEHQEERDYDYDEDEGDGDAPHQESMSDGEHETSEPDHGHQVVSEASAAEPPHEDRTDLREDPDALLLRSEELIKRAEKMMDGGEDIAVAEGLIDQAEALSREAKELRASRKASKARKG